jgi:hypothetical protein
MARPIKVITAGAEIRAELQRRRVVSDATRPPKNRKRWSVRSMDRRVAQHCAAVLVEERLEAACRQNVQARMIRNSRKTSGT